MRKDQNSMMFNDYPAGPLFGNTNDGVFYRALAKEIASLNSQGHTVQYDDASR